MVPLSSTASRWCGTFILAVSLTACSGSEPSPDATATNSNPDTQVHVAANTVQTSPPGGHAKGPERQAEEDEVPVMTDKPLTFKIIPRDFIRAPKATNSTARPSIKLLINGLAAPDDEYDVEAVRVFLNLPRADEKTSLKDPHYVSSFAFSPLKGAPNRKPESFQINLTRTLKRLQEKSEAPFDEAIQITLVPIASGESSLAGLELPIKALTVTIQE